MADMPAADVPHFKELFEAEERHFWFRSRARTIATIVRGLVKNMPKGFRVLEIGCGTGHVLRQLERACPGGDIMGAELHEAGVRLARQRVGCPVVQADIYRLAFDRPFQVIGLFDVLEHLHDPAGALGSVFNILAPGGRLVMTVPAHRWLWSHTDEAAGHFLRYSETALRQRLIQAGYRLDYMTQFMMPLAPVMFASRQFAALFHRRAARSSKSAHDLALAELRVVPVLNGVLNGLLSLETPFLARGWRLPLGTSLLAVAQRPQASRQVQAA